jgi:hypothetical protein
MKEKKGNILSLRSGLRQSGGAFGAAFYGTRKRVPLCKTDFFRSLLEA